MIELLNKYCIENKNDTGLMLLDMPTGSGKTYNVLQFIKNYLKQNTDKKIFFVTTLKKNLDDPYKDLINDLDKDPNLKDTVFRVLSNKEHAIKNFERVKSSIRIKEIRYSDQFKSFDALIKIASDKPELFGDIERDFRYLVSKVLSKKFKKKSDKLNAIKNDKDWQWVGELYPVVFSEEKRVFFITMKKLINKFDTIVEKSVRLYENSIFRNSLVFIDEFDATKKDIQDMIVQNGLSKGIDYIDLFRNIKICLDNYKSMPSNILDNVENKPSHKLALKKNIKIFDDIANKYHLLHHHKSVKFGEKRIVLFSDLTHNNYTTGDENVIVKFDDDENINKLELVPKGQKDRSLYEALDRIKGAISYFARFVAILAYSYKQNWIKKKEEGISYGEFTENHALDTVLDSLHLQGESYRIIKEMAFTFSNNFKPKTNNEEDLKDDLFFYSSGFSHYDFCDDYSHDNTTVIRKFVFEETPESVLYTICRTSKVVGISATATFNTVLGNYDIEYLEWKLGESFVTPSDEDKERLRNEFEIQTEGFKDVETVVQLTGTSSEEVPNWSNIYKDEELAEYAHNKTLCNNDKYKEVRYYKAVLAFKQFIDNNIQSYLALFSKAVKANDEDFDLNLLKQLFEYYTKDKGIEFKEELIEVLDSENFDSKKQNLIRALGLGERKFIISTYATIGAGQNLQYKIPDSRQNDIIKINDTRECTEMDIDGIYLDRPTNIVYRCSGEEENNINRVFQMEYLGQKKAISPNEKMAEIVRSYNSIDKDNDQIKPSNVKFSNLRDVKICATRTIVQAMGRKCRTNCRGRKVYILADSELGDSLDYNTLFLEKRMFNQEMVKLAEQFNYKPEPQKENRFIEDAKETSNTSNKRIIQYLTRCFENTWNEDDICKWNYLRDYVLQHPTLTTEEWKKSPFRQHYITFGHPVNKYWYEQTGDFDSINKIAETDFDNACQVSQEDVDLNGIFNTWDRIKELFVERGYIMGFEDGDYIMSPPLYHNIYKGALGEKVGHEIFKHFDIPLEDLCPEEHELFDFKVKGKPIYVDFKYWKESTHFAQEEYHKKVIEKAKGCRKIEKVVIANVRDTGFEEPSFKILEGIEIIEISLICDKRLSTKAASKIQELKNERNTDK